MIVEFSVKNFRSFRELATLSLEADKLKVHKDTLLSINVKDQLLPVVGIFGHNASGKSNLAKALAYMQWAMLNSDYLNQPTTRSAMLQPFLLNMESCKDPSFFQIVLWDSEEKIEYRYGFEINTDHIVSEWLEVTIKIKKNRRRRQIFLRKNQEFLKLDESIKKSVGHLTKNVRPTALALTVFAQFADPICSQVIQLLSRPNFMVIDGGIADLIGYAMQHYYEKPELAAKVLYLLKKLDLSIQDLKVIKECFIDTHTSTNELKPLFNQSNHTFRAVTIHNVHGSSEINQKVEFDFNNQVSSGTRHLFVLMTLLVQILEVGGTFVLDELGSNIHSFMSREIVMLFQNKDTNPKRAQLIFCSHETYLLSNLVGLRQDQIWFTEKNAHEETVLRSLLEYHMRSDTEKNYRQGRFGAVPVICS